MYPFQVIVLQNGRTQMVIYYTDSCILAKSGYKLKTQKSVVATTRARTYYPHDIVCFDSWDLTLPLPEIEQSLALWYHFVNTRNSRHPYFGCDSHQILNLSIQKYLQEPENKGKGCKKLTRFFQAPAFNQYRQ